HACLPEVVLGKRNSLLGVIEPDHRSAIERRQMKDKLAAEALALKSLLGPEERDKSERGGGACRNDDSCGAFGRGTDIFMGNNACKIGKKNVELAVYLGSVRNDVGRGFDAEIAIPRERVKKLEIQGLRSLHKVLLQTSKMGCTRR